MMGGCLTPLLLLYIPSKYFKLEDTHTQLNVPRDFLKTRFSRCMLCRHNAAIGTYETCFFGIIVIVLYVCTMYIVDTLVYLL